MKNLKSFPPQKLPMSKKNQEWREACVNYISGAGNTGHSGFNSDRAEEMQTYYDLYNSIYNEKDLKYVTNPFKQQDGFPAAAQDYNIIKPYVDQLLGEETKRSFNFQVCRTSDEATSELQEKAKQMLMDYIMASIQSKMSPEDQQRYQQALETGEIMQPEAIQKYVTRDYKDIAESTAYHILQYLKRKLNITHEFYKGWKDALIGGEEIYYVGILNGSPHVERVNPMYFDYEKSVDLEYIHDASWCCRKMIMSATDIYDRFYDKMSEKQLNELLELIDQKPGSGMSPQIGKSEMDYNHIKLHRINSFTDNPFDSDQITVYHCCWKSFKKIGFVTILNPETQEIEEFQVDEDYKVTGDEQNVEWRWIIEVWEGYRIGDDLYIGIQPIEYQHISADNPNSQRLPYTGVVYNNTNSKPRSLVSMMKPLQYMYIVVWYRLELAMSRDKGKVALIDVTQIPKSMGIDVNKWMHYLSALGVAFINPAEEGWDVPGREGGRCFIKGTKVLMYNGSIKNIEDIQLFDQVMGPDGTPRTVLELHHGKDHMYKITPSSGGNIQIVNSKHEIYYGYKNHHTDEVIFETSTPAELLEKFTRTPSCRDKYYLYRTKGSNFGKEKINNSFDPYLLGLWLGDGNCSKPAITTTDYEVMDYLEEFALDNKMKIRYEKIRGEKALNVNLAYTDKSKKGYRNKPINYLLSNLKRLGVYNNKHIPKEYIYCCESDRLQLLAGLIDSDGWYDSKKKRFGFSQVDYRKDIAYDFAFIARSLGMKVSIRKKKQKPSKLCPNVSEYSYVVSILSGCERIPTKIKRKQAKGDKFHQKDIYRSMFNIEYYGIDEYYGFSLDKDHLFLLDDFTICHNSAQFNQFQSWDLSMANIIDQYVNLMAKIEDMVARLTGITPQRQGSIAASELVGNATQAITQSYHVTEPWFWTHNQVKKEVLTMLLDTAKSAWKDNKTCLNYVLDDATRAFLTLSEDFFYSDLDVFVEDSTKNRQDLDALRQLMQPAMQNGASLLDIAEIITMDNINMIKNRLEDIEQKRMEQMQQQQQQEQEAQQQLIEEQNRIKEEELMLKEAEMDLEKYKIDTDSQTKIAVAQINAYRNAENMDQDGNGQIDVMEIGKQAIDRLKVDADIAQKQLDSRNKSREIETKKEIENKKIQLEKDRMKHELELQKLSDKAAMEREQLKARTALKNKTSGESKK